MTSPSSQRDQLRRRNERPHPAEGMGEQRQVRPVPGSAGFHPAQSPAHKLEFCQRAARYVVALLLLVGLTVLPSAQAQICAPPPAGLVAWWPGEGTAEDIQGTHNGALMNGAAFITGEVGQALNFDGVDDYVVVPDFKGD